MHFLNISKHFILYCTFVKNLRQTTKFKLLTFHKSWNFKKIFIRERERISQDDSLLSAESNVGLNPMTLRSWPELNSQVRCLTD